MQIVINNVRRPAKEGLYFTEDTAGIKDITRFRDGNWRSQTGHPVEKWIDNNEPSFTLKDMREAWGHGHSVGAAIINPEITFETFVKEEFNIDITKQ